jgi:hypothetical protein
MRSYIKRFVNEWIGKVGLKIDKGNLIIISIEQINVNGAYVLTLCRIVSIVPASTRGRGRRAELEEGGEVWGDPNGSQPKIYCNAYTQININVDTVTYFDDILIMFLCWPKNLMPNPLSTLPTAKRVQLTRALWPRRRPRPCTPKATSIVYWPAC